MKKLLPIIFLLIFACSKHDDPPPQISVIEPPIPTNFTVTSPTPGIFDLSWDVGDPSAVNYYRLYYLDPFFSQLTFADTTAATSIQFDVGAAITELMWGVSSVTVENVEGTIVYATVQTP
jgi:hypothetical protein